MFTPNSALRLSLAAVLVSLSAICVGGCRDTQLPGMNEVVTFPSKGKEEGIRQYNAGQYEAAIGSFKNALHTEPRDYKLYFYLAACYDQLRDYQQAITYYQSSLDTAKLTLAGREDAAFRMRSFDALASAIARSDRRNTELDARERQARNGNNAENYFLLAKIYRYSGDADSALASYNKATLLEPKNVTMLKEYGLYLEKLGQTARAEVPLRQAYVVDPDDKETAAALRRLGIVPGPAIKEEKDLVQPPIPQGPLPESPLNRLGNSGSSSTDTIAPKD